MFWTVVVIVLIFYSVIATVNLIKLNIQVSDILDLEVRNRQFKEEIQKIQQDLVFIRTELVVEQEKNKTLLSQKKSSETRLGQISEHIVPFLEGCRHDPKSLIFLGNPIDYVAFNFDEGSITFLEVKSGNSKASKRQKTVKNIVKTGRIFYEELRINESGVKSRVTGLDEEDRKFDTVKKDLSNKPFYKKGYKNE